MEVFFWYWFRPFRSSKVEGSSKRCPALVSRRAEGTPDGNKGKVYYFGTKVVSEVFVLNTKISNGAFHIWPSSELLSYRFFISMLYCYCPHPWRLFHLPQLPILGSTLLKQCLYIRSYIFNLQICIPITFLFKSVLTFFKKLVLYMALKFI